MLSEITSAQLVDLEEEIAKLSSDEKHKKLFLLIDEVHHNTNDKNWLFLLKKSKHIFTIGAGIPRVGYSPQFEMKLTPFDILFTDDEIDSCIACFRELFPNKYPDEVLGSVLQWTLKFTGGHSYPFLKLSWYLLSDLKDKCTNGTFDSVVLNADFSSNIAIVNIMRRAYGDSRIIEDAKMVIKDGGDRCQQIPFLKYSGVWDLVSNRFISSFFVSICLGSIMKEENSIEFNWDEKDEALQKVLLYSLSRMDETDFFDSENNKYRIENAISSVLASNMSTIPGLQVRFQVPLSMGVRKSGHPPTIDMFLNGKLGRYLEVVRNGNDANLFLHSDKFEKEDGGYHKHVDEYALLNIDLQSDSVPQTPIRSKNDVGSFPNNKLYTFVKNANALYKGSTLIKSNVSTRSFHLMRFCQTIARITIKKA
jgi:hypothetical protein